jgi:cytochrome c oxidase cbb3-type subunit 3
MSQDPNKHEAKPLDHDADGIQELDNLLPRWWVWLFWGCNVFALFYMLYYHVGNYGDSQAAAYVKEAKIGDDLKNAALAKFEATLTSLQPSKDKATLDQGRSVYMTYCAPCHRPDGGGLVGPNLCDDYWIHGATYADHLKVIINGVPEKGMLTWRGILKPQEIQQVASFVHALQGTKPPNPKLPENQQPAASNKPSEFE